MGTDTRAYNSVATLLVHESAEVTDLGRVLIQFRHTFRDKVNDGPAAIMLTELLEPLPESPVSRAALPLLDLRIADNDFDCEVNGVSLADLIPLGGLRIEGNRIRTPNGQAVRVEAVAMFTNARLLALLVRTGLDRLLESLKEGDPFTTIGEWIDIDLSGLAEELAAKLDEWQRGVESILGTDFRIARNKIRARRTAIEFNVFEEWSCRTTTSRCWSAWATVRTPRRTLRSGRSSKRSMRDPSSRTWPRPCGRAHSSTRSITCYDAQRICSTRTTGQRSSRRSRVFRSAVPTLSCRTP